jgi:protein-L-isoaspartate(D-aspartate) O-methyltransferase
MLRFSIPCTKDGAVFVCFRGLSASLSEVLEMSDFATARQRMVDGQVRTSDVTDNRILDAMLALPREAFVPDDKRALAYLDLDLDVAGGGGVAKRFLVKPVLTAKLLQAAELGGADNVLVVGAATGYAAALAAALAGKVTATESDPALCATGKDVLGKLGFDGKVTFKTAEAAAGDASAAPYDAIILNGASEIMPQTLFSQLKEGGRLLGVFALTMPSRALIVTHSHGDFGNRTLFDATAPILPGLERLPAFVF